MPLKGSFRIDRALSNMSVRYDNAEYIAPKFMKDLMVEKESGNYYIYNNDLRQEPTIRANGSVSKMASFDVSTSSYLTNEHALKDGITDRDKNNTDDVFQLQVDTVEYLTSKIQISFERETAQLCFTTATWGNNESLDTNSSFKYNTTTSNPVGKILSVTSFMKQYAGVMANAMVIGQAGRDALKENNNIIDRIKYTQRGILTNELLASMFDIDNIYVGSAMYNTLDEGLTASLTSIWGDHCLVAFFDNVPKRKSRTAAANIRMQGRPAPWRVKRWRDDDREADMIEVQTFFKPKAVATVSAYLLKSVSAS